MISDTFKSFAKRAVSRLSPRLQSFVLERSAMERLKVLHQRRRIRTIYDIGAHKGGWAKSIKADFPDATIFLFEANTSHSSSLEKTGFSFHLGLLSDRPQQKRFYHVPNGGTGDSVYRENSRHYGAGDYELVNCQSLDAVVAERGFPKPDFLKIDTQGSELDVLRGGEDTVTAASYLLLECPIVNYNMGAPNLPEYISYLDDISFMPHRLSELHDINGVLVQVDILFVRKDLIQ